MAITWTVNFAEVWSRDGKSDVVDAVNWRCAYVEGKAEKAFEEGRTEIPYDAEASFQSFASLPEEDMLAWVHSALGDQTAATEMRVTRAATIRNETPPKVKERLARK